METQQLIGKLLDETAQRDAIHIAVAPVIAYRTMTPGMACGLTDGQGDPASENPIGIVDPFLKEPVRPGARFFLFLYPNTAKSLRHVYEHPGLPSETEVPQDIKESRRWMEDYADRCGESYEDLMLALSHEGRFNHDIDMNREILDEAWMHFARLGGRLHRLDTSTWKYVATDLRPQFFCCAC